MDVNVLVTSIVGQSTGEPIPTSDEPLKNIHAVALGRLGGKRGGPARAEKLTSEQRKEIARKAAKARWAKRGM